MLLVAIGFLLAALVAAGFGFFGLATSAVTFAKILFLVFLVLFLIAAAIRAADSDDKQ